MALKNIRIQYLNWNLGSKVIIWVFTTILFLLAALTPSTPIGESDDYMATTLALENHFSLQILDSDIEQSKFDFPEHYERLRSSYDNAALGTNDFVIDKEGNRYPWYMGTYSLVCLPIKLMLKMLGLNQSMAFQLTNAMFYVLALAVVYFKLKADDKTKFLTILLLVCSPTTLYFFWASAEMFMFSLVTMAMVFFVNRSYRLSALLIAVVGTLNPTVMPLGMVLIADYFVFLYQENQSQERNFFKICLLHFWDIVKFGVCFLPFFVTYIFNYIKFGTFNLQSSLGLTRTDGWLGRIIAYLFDLNFGFLPYFPIALALFFVLSIWAIIWKRHTRSLLFLIAFLFVVTAYSITWHINCGMSGLSRYGSWSFSIFIFYLTTQVFPLMTRKIFCNVFTSLLIVSACWTTSYTYIITASNTGMDYKRMSPMAMFVLDRAPQFYNPYYYTFISRVENVDGGYWTTPSKPVAYSNGSGYVKKILVMNSEDIFLLRKRFIGNAKSTEQFLYMLTDLDENKKYQYLNIPYNMKLVDLEKIHPMFDPTIYTSLDKTLNRGVHGNEETFHWIEPDAEIILLAGDIQERGLLMKYNVNAAIFSAVRLPEYYFKVYINGTYIATQPLTGEGEFKLLIPSEAVPNTELLYRVQIVTNASFCPAKMGYSSDTRNLALALQYIGVAGETVSAE